MKAEFTPNYMKVEMSDCFILIARQHADECKYSIREKSKLPIKVSGGFGWGPKGSHPLN